MSEVERTSLRTSRRQGVNDVESGAQEVPVDLRPTAQTEVEKLLNSAAGRRTTTPVRKAFVRTEDRESPPPLAQIVSTRGRGGAVPLKLYLGLIRRSSAAPFDSTLSARRWATLLDLDDPNHRGARRVNDAIARLQDLRLIHVEPSRGAASRIVLLREDGSSAAYTPPSEWKPSRRGPRTKPELYLQMPDRLWQGYIQPMSASALAMLLILLAEPESSEAGMWWSVRNFPDWYHISASMRSSGTRELEAYGLLHVKKQMLDTARGGNGDDRDRVRNVYRLTGAALRPTAAPALEPTANAPAEKRRRGVGGRE